MAKEEGFSASVWQDIYSSDGIPFADKGIPAINVLRQAAGGLTCIHCRTDVITQVDAKYMAKTAAFLETISDRFVGATVFPITKKIPDNMVEKVNKYLGKKTEQK